MHIQKAAVRHTDCGFSIQRTGPARINARVLPIRSKWNLENYLFKESFFDIFFAADIGYGVFTSKSLRIVSQICASHIPHAIPSIDNVVLIVKCHPFFSFLWQYPAFAQCAQFAPQVFLPAFLSLTIERIINATIRTSTAIMMIVK